MASLRFFFSGAVMAVLDTYYTRTQREKLSFPALEGEIDVDTLVVGGGLAGCATALDLAERGQKVALIEAKTIGWGASGRNGGFASDGFPSGYETLVKKIGVGRAREFFRLAQMGHRLLRERIDKYAIDCGPLQEGALRCNIIGRGDNLSKFREFMAQTFDAEFDYWPREKVREALSTEQYTDGVFNPRTYAVQPLDLTCGMARACSEAGVKVFEKTPAEQVNATSSGRSVKTKRGKINAGRIVLACGGYIDGLDPKVSSGTIPIATFVMATEPLGDKLKEAIRIPYAISDNQVGVNYYRPLADTRVLWGGRVLAWEPSPERIATILKRDMVRFYPALRNAKVEVAWGGLMPFTRHKLPVIGQVAPDVWYATGFGGLGVALTTTVGRVMADAITQGDETWKLFEAFGLPMAGGKLGRIPAQLVYWRHAFAARFLRFGAG